MKCFRCGDEIDGTPTWTANPDMHKDAKPVHHRCLDGVALSADDYEMIVEALELMLGDYNQPDHVELLIENILRKIRLIQEGES